MSSRVPAALWRNLIAVQIYGANTGVGKTVFSTLLGAHFLRRPGKRWKLNYIKPVSTGPSSEADDGYVGRFTKSPVSTLLKFKEPVSPHVAARGAEYVPSDGDVLQHLFMELKKNARPHSTPSGGMGLSIIETAGGVLSPGPNGTPQADMFRPMRLPVILVGDHRLGGIASTISAAESLIIRGYDIEAVICFDDKSQYENAAYLREYFDKMGIPAIDLPWIPPNLDSMASDEEAACMQRYYEKESQEKPLHQIGKQIIDRHNERLMTMDDMASRTKDAIWHPFTQHKHIENAEDIMVFDSAYGDMFQAKHTGKSHGNIEDNNDTPILYPAFDGSASWWTQGLGHGNPKLSLAAAYAAGRYGHVMFAGATHEPALTLAERLLKGLDNPRLKKVFYTDDGSTATEVGIKMGLRAACKRYDWDGSTENIDIIGLKGSYHGDTIGAMDASEPCVFNKKVDWYRGRGYWFDFPTIKMREGSWRVEPPLGMEKEFGPPKSFDSIEHIFNLNERKDSTRYEKYIEDVLDTLVKKQGRKFGALVMEPVILGAGGMLFVDPLFQRTLVNVVRRYRFGVNKNTHENHEIETWTGLPVMFDEVFTGLYRLGQFSSASFLSVHPDISVHAKLLTGGLLPLSVTVASQSIFDAFWGDEKSDALLHGHSYTAHAIGCHVANVSLEEMNTLAKSNSWQDYREDWKEKDENSATSKKKNAVTTVSEKQRKCWSMWSQEFVTMLSHHPSIDYVNALGSVLAVSIKDTAGSGGYTSTASIGLRDALLHNIGPQKIQIHSRVLGNVIYMMASMNSEPKLLEAVQQAFLEKLNFVSVAKDEKQ